MYIDSNLKCDEEISIMIPKISTTKGIVKSLLNTETAYYQRSFNVSVLRLWNNLPFEIQKSHYVPQEDAPHL